MKDITHIKRFNESDENNSSSKTNEGWFSKKPIEDRSDVGPDMKLKEIDLKISDAAYSLKTFGTMTKQGAFINGAKWAIHNLTDDEIKYLRENSNKDDFSFFGL